MRKFHIYVDVSVIGECELEKFRLYNAVNFELGYGVIVIRTPWEVLSE